MERLVEVGSGRYQVIVQIDWTDDLPHPMEIDEDLEGVLGPKHEVDNSDPMNFGLNLYILTGDPVAAIRATRDFLDRRGWSWLLRKASYRPLDPAGVDMPFAVAWPEGCTEDFRYDYDA